MMKAAARMWIPGLVTAVVLLGASSVCGAVEFGSDSEYPKLRVMGFTDFTFITEDQAEGGSDSGFEEGQFVLHFSSALQARLSFFAELSFTSTDDENKTDLERAILRYEFNDWAKVSVGRYHTAINWWNTRFHHGLWLQTTVDRPEMIKFGGKFLPVHFEGLLFEGTTTVRSSSLSYEIGIGNGRDDSITGAGGAGDVNNHRATVGHFSFRPDRIYDLEVGGSFYLDKISLATEYDETILAAHLAWTRETPEIIAEFAQVEHDDDATGLSYTSNAYYLQVAYRLKAFKARLKPYARYEEVDVDGLDPLFADLGDLERMLVGVRIDFSRLAAIKIEGRHDRLENEDSRDAALAQVNFTF